MKGLFRCCRFFDEFIEYLHTTVLERAFRFSFGHRPFFARRIFFPVAYLRLYIYIYTYIYKRRVKHDAKDNLFIYTCTEFEYLLVRIPRGKKKMRDCRIIERT